MPEVVAVAVAVDLRRAMQHRWVVQVVVVQLMWAMGLAESLVQPEFVAKATEAALVDTIRAVVQLQPVVVVEQVALAATVSVSLLVAPATELAEQVVLD
jgi:hypothetical protein